MDERIRKLQQLIKTDPTLISQYKAELVRAGLIPSDAEVATLYRGYAVGGVAAIKQATRLWAHLFSELAKGALKDYSPVEPACNCRASHVAGCEYYAWQEALAYHREQYQDVLYEISNAIKAVEEETFDLEELSDMWGFCEDYIHNFIGEHNAYPDDYINIYIHFERNTDYPELEKLTLMFLNNRASSRPITRPELIYDAPTRALDRYTRLLRIEIYVDKLDKNAWECMLEWDTGKRSGDPNVLFFGNLPTALQYAPGAWREWASLI